MLSKRKDAINRILMFINRKPAPNLRSVNYGTNIVNLFRMKTRGLILLISFCSILLLNGCKKKDTQQTSSTPTFDGHTTAITTDSTAICNAYINGFTSPPT